MPPSPALRCSPGRELPGKKHRRGHSIEYGILFRDKDEDLALFSEMQDKERDGFLLQSSDDLEDAFSTKLKHFSEFTIPVQGESSRLLSAEGDKNDYDWLLTPPDTPLFPSLDDEPRAASVERRGRPQSQISLSRSSTMEKRRRSSKGSASPNRLSTSPRADNMQQIRGRPSSARHPSPASGQRSVTPVRRISPTPGKPSGPISRSSTPTSRRMSTGSTTMASPALRGTSPVRSSRGNSASPKIKVWQSNIPGFSLDAPPNLRTSLGDRPASYVRGSSPASRNGRDAASTRSRQSVSPSASRSVSSSHSHERDRFSSHSKGSVASSGDDDLHSIQSILVGGSERAVPKRASLSPNSRTSRHSKLLSPGSAPRRPFESALRQMDHPKSQHSMFRPLASSLPSTGIYSGKGSSSYHHLMVRHSSATMESNLSSGQGIGFMPDAKGSDPIPIFQSEVVDYPDKHGEITASGMVDLLNEGSRHESHESSFSDQLGDMDQGYAVECESIVNEEVNHHVSDVENSSTHGSLHVGNDFLEGVALETMEVCGRCGSHYRTIEATGSEINICPDCREEQILAETDSPGTTTALDENFPKESQEIFAEKNIEQFDNSYKQEQNHLRKSSIFGALEDQDMETLNHQDEIQSSTDGGLLGTGTKDTQTQLSDGHNDVKMGSSVGRDVPLLIKRSVSMKLPINKANNSSCFTRSYEGFSYLRDKSISLRSSTETTSASSSWDCGSSIRKGSHVRHQSGSTLDMETHRYDTNSKSLSSMSSPSGFSSQACQALNVMTEDSFQVSAAQMTCAHDETHRESRPELQDPECDETNVMNADFGESVESIGTSTNVVGAMAEHNPEIVDDGFCENGDDVANTVMSKVEISESPTHVRSTSELGASPVTDECALYDHSKLQEKDGNETPRHGSSTTTASEIEPENCEPETPGLVGVHDEIPESECNLNAVDDCSEKSMAHDSVDHHNSSVPVNEILDESTVIVECPGRKEPKSLTLEEATDTILFCSSIVHDLVYQATTVAMEKAKEVPAEEEALHLHPAVTVLGKSNANRTSYRTKAKKQSSKSAKASRKQTETEEKTDVQIENDENAGEAVMIRNVGVPPRKGDNMKPPPKLENKCNCSIM
uniref:Microtubule-associated protein futsch n=1 Tax=Noccaea caerulescens TaxID=107243 RepID=A0A1J3FRF8_NOCCA